MDLIKHEDRQGSTWIQKLFYTTEEVDLRKVKEEVYTSTEDHVKEQGNFPFHEVDTSSGIERQTLNRFIGIYVFR